MAEMPVNPDVAEHAKKASQLFRVTMDVSDQIPRERNALLCSLPREKTNSFIVLLKFHHEQSPRQPRNFK